MLRLYWNGFDAREGTALLDTPENRILLESKVKQINEEMRKGSFDYLAHFPDGNKASYFRQERLRLGPRTLRSYFQDWIKGFAPPLAKRSRYRNYKAHFDNHILPAHGDRYMDQYGVTEIRELLSSLVKEKGVTVKTAKNILNASLRAMFRDAVAEKVIESSPFDLLPPKFWPKSVKPRPDPFEESERDEILAHLRGKLYPKWPAGYVFCYTLFWAGMRPSELTPRRWSDLDFRTGKLDITTSRTEGEEGETKTHGSNRTIQLFPGVLELIKTIKPLRAQPDDYIFLDQRGNPINHWKYGERYFQGALTALELRHRDFYHTRHTFISVMLSHGENLKETAEYVGSSPMMLSANYGKFIGHKGTFGQAAMQAAEEERASK